MVGAVQFQAVPRNHKDADWSGRGYCSLGGNGSGGRTGDLFGGIGTARGVDRPVGQLNVFGLDLVARLSQFQPEYGMLLQARPDQEEANGAPSSRIKPALPTRSAVPINPRELPAWAGYLEIGLHSLLGQSTRRQEEPQVPSVSRETLATSCASRFCDPAHSHRHIANACRALKVLP